MSRHHLQGAPRILAMCAGAIPPSPQNLPAFHARSRWDQKAHTRAIEQRDVSPYGGAVDALYKAVGGFRVPGHEYMESMPGWRAFLERVNAAGFTLLGCGYFSAVFQHKSNPGLAFKFGFKKEDSGAAYAAWCRANKGRAAVPNVHMITRRSAGYVVVMDKYEPYWSAPTSRPVARELDDFKSVIYRRHEGRHEHLTPAQYATVMDIRNFFEGMARFDLHSDNVMYDPRTDQLIITDPVSFKPGTEF